MNGFNEKERKAIRPGDLVRFGQTTGDYVSNWVDGVVLSVGESKEWDSNRVVDGAIVAWHNRYPAEGYAADYVTFCPFWNQRFQPVRK